MTDAASCVGCLVVLVTAMSAARAEEAADAGAYVLVQAAGAVVGVLAAHLMFEESLWQVSTKVRAGPSQWFSEWVACFGLVATILLTLKGQPGRRAQVSSARGINLQAQRRRPARLDEGRAHQTRQPVARIPRRRADALGAYAAKSA